jgi:DNA-binding transcriptional ArsR family regulator
MPTDKTRRAARQQMFEALADPNRRMIMELLASNGQMSATEIYGNFTVSHPAVSQHLRVLREAELVQLEKDAQRRIYSLNPEGMSELEDWLKELTDLWSRRFDKLDEVLRAEKRRRAKGGGK